MKLTARAVLFYGAVMTFGVGGRSIFLALIIADTASL